MGVPFSVILGVRFVPDSITSPLNWELAHALFHLLVGAVREPPLVIGKVREPPLLGVPRYFVESLEILCIFLRVVLCYNGSVRSLARQKIRICSWMMS